MTEIKSLSLTIVLIRLILDKSMLRSLKHSSHIKLDKATKSIRRMPWYMEAMKDVVSCDKLRVGAHNR